MTRSRRVLMVSTAFVALVMGGLGAALLNRDSDAGTSTLRAKLPQPSMTTFAEAPAEFTAPAAFAVPPKTAGEISRVVVNLSEVPGKTSTLTQVPQPGRVYDLHAACVSSAADGSATVELSEGPADATPAVSMTIECDGIDRVVASGPGNSRLAIPSLTGKGASSVQGYAILVEH